MKKKYFCLAVIVTALLAYAAFRWQNIIGQRELRAYVIDSLVNSKIASSRKAVVSLQQSDRGFGPHSVLALTGTKLSEYYDSLGLSSSNVALTTNSKVANMIGVTLGLSNKADEIRGYKTYINELNAVVIIVLDSEIEAKVFIVY